jgi:hypothetical protein
MTERVFRYDIPIYGEPRELEFAVGPLHVEAREIGIDSGSWVLDVWALHVDGQEVQARTFQVFGTGWELPSNARYQMTANRARNGLVWHLFELVDEGTA